MQGSTDTTFYILTVYFGSVGIKKVRHALLAGILGDIAGFLAAVYICQMVLDRHDWDCCCMIIWDSGLLDCLYVPI